MYQSGYLLVLLIWVLAGLPLKIHATGTEPLLTIRRMQGEFKFDGYPDEAAWLAADPLPMVTHQPVFGKEPEERTEIRILFDDQYIYVGASMYTKDPSTIMNSSKKRDEMKPDCDWIAVVFDTYNDNQTGMAFWTTPSGLRTDMEIFNDAMGTEPMPINGSWNTHWDVKSNISEQGWFSEILIPVSSLRFQEDENGEVIMGIIALRWIPYHDATYIFPAIPNEYGPWSMLKVSLARDARFPGLKSKKPLYITPYATAGLGQLNGLNDAETDYEYSRDYQLNAGLDAKYGITSNLTMDLTLNTDFAQAEADDQQVNLTRFDLYFEEKRQFFLERASVFDFNSGGSTTMFYSRRIGLDEDGQIVPIIGGARFIGRSGGFDYALLNMQTARSDSLPSENFGVARIKKRLFNENSYLGGIFTSRLGLDGSFNQAYGVDGLFRITGDEYLGFMWGQTFENGLENRAFGMDNARYRLGWERKKNRGLHYELFISGTGADYNPGIGFQSRFDYHLLGGYLNYLRMPGESSVLLRHGPRSTYRVFYNISHGRKETVELVTDYLLEFKNLWLISLGPVYNQENIFEEFDLSDDAVIPVGFYEFTHFKGVLQSPMTNPFWIYAEGIGGEYFDGSVVNITCMPNWSVSTLLTLNGTYIFSRVNLPARSQIYISHIGRIKALLMFTHTLSLSAFIQYNSDTRQIGSNVRFRYNPREGNDLWLVWNEDTNTGLYRELPYRPSLAGRILMIKYTYTFRL